MIHLLAISISNDYLLKLINKTVIEQTIDVEEDTDNDSKDKPCKFEGFNDDCLVNSLNSLNYLHSFYLQENLPTSTFQYLQINLPQSNTEILIPPPRA